MESFEGSGSEYEGRDSHLDANNIEI
jgi:hypothetical protein